MFHRAQANLRLGQDDFGNPLRLLNADLLIQSLLHPKDFRLVKHLGSHPIAVLEHDPPKPTGKRRRLTQFWQLPVGLKKCLLGRVFRQVKVTQNGVGVPVGHILKPPGNLPVGIHITVTRSGNQRFQIFHTNFRIIRPL